MVGGRGVSALPETPFRWLFFASPTVLSVKWGRGRWLPHRLWVAKVLISAFALLALPFLLAAAASSAAWACAESVNPAPEQFPAGLTRNDESITNVSTYDANGAPITGVQLFDQNGKPMSVTPPGGDFIRTSDAAALMPTHSATNGRRLPEKPSPAHRCITPAFCPRGTTPRPPPLSGPRPIMQTAGVTQRPGTASSARTAGVCAVGLRGRAARSGFASPGQRA